MWVIIPWLMSGSWVIGPRIDSTFVGSPLGFVGGSGGPHWEALSAMLHTKLVAVRARVLKALVFSCRIHLLNLRWSYIYVSHIEHRFFLSFFFFFGSEPDQWSPLFHLQQPPPPPIENVAVWKLPLWRSRMASCSHLSEVVCLAGSAGLNWGIRHGRSYSYAPQASCKLWPQSCSSKPFSGSHILFDMAEAGCRHPDRDVWSEIKA